MRKEEIFHLPSQLNQQIYFVILNLFCSSSFLGLTFANGNCFIVTISIRMYNKIGWLQEILYKPFPQDQILNHDMDRKNGSLSVYLPMSPPSFNFGVGEQPKCVQIPTMTNKLGLMDLVAFWQFWGCYKNFESEIFCVLFGSRLDTSFFSI